jgi:hypothetical protein
MWVDNIRMDLTGIGWEHGDWIHLTSDRDQWWALVSVAINLHIP